MTASQIERQFPFTNDLPPIPSDCVLPIFQVPEVDKSITIGSQIITALPPLGFQDPLLGIPVDLCDLSKYSQPATVQDFFEPDSHVLSSLKISTTSYGVEQQQVFTPEPRKVVQPSVKHNEPTFKPSPFYEDENDESIREQLECAFNGEVPPGEVHLITQEPSYVSVTVVGAETLDPENLLLLAKGEHHMKIVKPEGGQPLRGYTVTSSNSNEVCYLVRHEDGTIGMGSATRILKLRAINNREMRENPLTGREVNFVEE